MEDDRIANAFNNWMEVFLRDPEGSEARFQEQVARYKADIAAGRVPSYGKESVELLWQYAE